MSTNSAQISQYDLSNLDDPKDFQKYGSQVIGQISNLLNGNMMLSQLNLNEFSVKFVQANTDTTVTHNLNKIGVKFIVTGIDGDANIWYGVGTDKNNLRLRSSVAPINATLILY